ncbi:MAG TPA: sterol desaturase family protein [Acidimicrobiales bacterium]|nr:sterol desaturase family protein [Acidimicrobiales bacterium]
MRRPGTGVRDLTVVAIPFYFGGMAVEYLWLQRHAARRDTTAVGYERRDTLASLAMGVGSLVAPLIVPRILAPVTPGKGRWGRVTVAAVVAAAAVTTVADHVVRRDARRWTARPTSETSAIDVPPAGEVDSARRVAAVAGVTAVALGGAVVASTWADRTAPGRLWKHHLLPDLGRGPVALALAIAGWDFIYYWNHRIMHECRYLWAIHVVHHSSERYNLSTALRQPVADAVGPSVPYGLLCLAGISPELVATARGVNLLYQFWIHTEAVGRLGAPEKILNSPSHHRVHHGSNSRYLDRNHGSILILWDRLFGTFEREAEPAVYGLTKDIDTFDPVRIATHEFVELFGDVARSTGWGERLSHVVRGPGWRARHPEAPEPAACPGLG